MILQTYLLKFLPEKIFYDLLRWIAKVFYIRNQNKITYSPKSKRAHSKSLNELLNMILLEELLKKKNNTKDKNPDSQMEILRCSGNVANHCFFYFYLFKKKKKTREWVRWLIHENQWLFLLYKYGTWQTSGGNGQGSLKNRNHTVS